MPSATKPASQPVMNENAPGPCQICGADQCCGHDAPASSDQAAPSMIDFKKEIEVRDCEDVGSCFFCGNPLSILEYGQHDSFRFAVSCSDEQCFVNSCLPDFSTKAEAKASLETARRFTSYFCLTNQDAVECFFPPWKRFFHNLFCRFTKKT